MYWCIAYKRIIKRAVGGNKQEGKVHWNWSWSLSHKKYWRVPAVPLIFLKEMSSTNHNPILGDYFSSQSPVSGPLWLGLPSRGRGWQLRLVTVTSVLTRTLEAGGPEARGWPCQCQDTAAPQQPQLQQQHWSGRHCLLVHLTKTLPWLLGPFWEWLTADRMKRKKSNWWNYFSRKGHEIKLHLRHSFQQYSQLRRNIACLSSVWFVTVLSVCLSTSVFNESRTQSFLKKWVLDFDWFDQSFNENLWSHYWLGWSSEPQDSGSGWSDHGHAPRHGTREIRDTGQGQSGHKLLQWVLQAAAALPRPPQYGPICTVHSRRIIKRKLN